MAVFYAFRAFPIPPPITHIKQLVTRCARAPVQHACDMKAARMPDKTAASGGPEILIGANNIARFLGATPRQVWHWCEKGHLPHFHIGKRLCARPETLRRWLEEQEQ